MSTKVRTLLGAPKRPVMTISPDSTVYEALHLLAEKDIGALIVTEGDNVVGIFSERDYARKVILDERCSRDTAVREIMSTRVLHVSPEQTLEECMALMTAKRFRHLPVVEHGRLVGVVSIGDAVKSIISEQEFLIDQLESYIVTG
jgi:CBS domain-containing protein